MEEPMDNPKNTLKLPTDSGEKAKPRVIQRWSAARKREIVLRLLRGESLDLVSREIGIEPYRLEHWRDKVLALMDARLKERAERRSAPGRTTSPFSGDGHRKVWACRSAATAYAEPD